MRRAGNIKRLQPDEAPDAMLDMHDEITGGKTCDLGDEVIELAARLAGPHQAVAENVLFGDERDLVGFKPGLHADHRQHGFVARRRLYRTPDIDAGQVEQLVVAQHAFHTVARAFAP